MTIALARSLPFLYWDDAFFDADQAVMGLMAKHIAEGVAWPVFQYGLSYVLVLEAWLAAPLMWIAPSSIALVKSVPIALNVATAGMLYAILTRGASPLGPAAAVLATLPVALPAFNTANQLTASIGMNIEPLFFGLVFWLLRDRPIALGVTAAIAIKNREFALYGVAALLFVDLLRDRTAALWRPRLAGAIAFAVTWSLVGLVTVYSSPSGPATSAALTGDVGSISDGNMAVATGSMCIEPDKIPGDLWLLASELLPFQFGVRSIGWRAAGYGGAQPPDATWLWWPLAGVLAFCVWRGLTRARRDGPASITWLGSYLVLVGLQAVLVYGTTRCGHTSLVTLRYTLLSVFAAAGAIALGLERESKTSVLAVVTAVCAIWIGWCVVGYAAVVRGFLASPPVPVYRQLATYLEAQDIRFIRADYRIGYHVAFLTGERVKPLTDFDRILDYTLAVSANMEQAVEVRRLTERRCEGAVVVSAFYVCPRRD